MSRKSLKIRTFCLVCKKEIWTIPSHIRRGQGKFCSRACTNHFYKFKTGKTRNHSGYILIRRPKHPQADKNGYILEHRFQMELALGRLLNSDEIVHHRNYLKDDNRFENLELTTRAEHTVNHINKVRGGILKHE